MGETAILLANNHLQTIHAKTSHALIRGPSRYRILGVVDPSCAGRDAGEVLDGRPRAIPVAGSVDELLRGLVRRPDYCIVGVATKGGLLPEALRADLIRAAEAGLSLVNGLHHLLSDDEELASLVRRRGGHILDIRKPRPTRELHFWTGAVLDLATPRVAVLGMDCAIGKRTTCTLLRDAARRLGLRAEMVYTGQTGWLIGLEYGFILDATPNDFVSGELERAILECHERAHPEVILIEGQSALRNPSGPCGFELVISAAAQGVILQHAPGRRYFEGLEETGRKIPPVRDELALIRLLGSEVWAVTLNTENMAERDAEPVRQRLEEELGLPVVFPLRDGGDELARIVRDRLADTGRGA